VPGSARLRIAVAAEHCHDLCRSFEAVVSPVNSLAQSRLHSTSEFLYVVISESLRTPYGDAAPRFVSEEAFVTWELPALPTAVQLLLEAAFPLVAVIFAAAAPAALAAGASVSAYTARQAAIGDALQ
jgi:hypothetical protein